MKRVALFLATNLAIVLLLYLDLRLLGHEVSHVANGDMIVAPKRLDAMHPPLQERIAASGHAAASEPK